MSSQSRRRGDRGVLRGAPAGADEIAGWCRDVLDLSIADRPLLAGSDAPLAYLAHAFLEQTPADCVVWANRGGGKTLLAAVATALDLVYKPGIEVRVLAGSVEQGSRMHAHLRRIFGRPALRDLVDGRITDRRLRLVNGSGVELLAQSQASVRGTRVQKLRCDEVELFDPEVWEAAQLVTRSKRCGGVMARGSVECLSTMHVPHGIMHRLVHGADGPGPASGLRRPRRVFRWGVVDVLGACGPEHRCRGAGHASSPAGDDGPRAPGDCPLWPECGGRAKQPGVAGHVTIDDAIGMKARVAPTTWESEMLCLRPRRTDAVIPEFDPALHVVDVLPWDAAPADPDDPAPARPLWVAGMDFGFRSPTVILWAAVDARGAVWVAFEHVRSGELLGAHVAALLSGDRPAPEWVGADPAGGATNSQTGSSDVDALRKAGLKVRTRRVPVREGLSLVRARLKPADGSPPRLYVHRRCSRLIESLEGYHFPADRPDSDDPVKDGADHAVDALRYLVTNLDRGYTSTAGSYLAAGPTR